MKCLVMESHKARDRNFHRTIEEEYEWRGGGRGGGGEGHDESSIDKKPK